MPEKNCLSNSSDNTPTIIQGLKYGFINIILATIIACALLVLTYAIPPQTVQQNLKSSSFTLINEGEVPRYSRAITGAKIDNFTASIMLMTASFDGTDNLLYNALANKRIDFKRKNQPANLFFALTTPPNNEAEIVEYARYWHGYLIILKPLLLGLDLTGIRIASFILQTLLLLTACFLIFKRLGGTYVVAFLAAIFCLNPVTIALSLPFSGVYTLMLIALIAVLTATPAQWYKIFLWTGIATAFIDLLSAPLITLGLPLIFCLCLTPTGLKQGFNTLLKCSTSWLVGYAGFWFSKWIIATVVLNKNIMSDGLNSVLYRTSGNGYTETGLTGWNGANAIARNLAELNTTLTIAVILLCLGMIVLTGLIQHKSLVKDSRVFFILLTGAYPFFWYLIVTNHSIIHPLMSYRLLAISILALTTALAVSLQNRTTAQLKKSLC